MEYKPKWNPPKHNPMMCTNKKCTSRNCRHNRKGHSFHSDCKEVCDNNPDGLPCVSTIKPMTQCLYDGCTEMIEYKPNKRYCESHRIAIKCKLNNQYSERYRKAQKDRV